MGLPSPRVTCQAAQASVPQPGILFDFLQLLQVQTQLLGKQPQENTSAPTSLSSEEESTHKSHTHPAAPHTNHTGLSPQPFPYPQKHLTGFWPSGAA